MDTPAPAWNDTLPADDSPTNSLVKWFGLEKALKIISSNSALLQAEKDLSATVRGGFHYSPEFEAPCYAALRVVRALIG